jgi:hypothetical protein
MRYLNGFILTSVVLFLVGAAGAVKGNALLTEPGMPVNPWAWQQYLGAAVLMLVNGVVSVWVSRRHDGARAANMPVPPPAGGSEG